MDNAFPQASLQDWRSPRSTFDPPMRPRHPCRPPQQKELSPAPLPPPLVPSTTTSRY